MLLQLLLYAISITPARTLSSKCNITMNSDVLAHAYCEEGYNYTTTFDFKNRVITVLGAPLDSFTCSRFIFRMNNTVIKNANFYLNATVESDERCPKQYFGIFDTQSVENFTLDNVRITGKVYIDYYADAVVGAVFAFYAMEYPETDDGGTYRVTTRGGLTRSFYLPTYVFADSVFSVGYQVKVYKLKAPVFDELTQRTYEASQLTEVTSYTNETSFTNEEYYSDYFPYSYLVYETISYTSGADKKYGRSAAFSLYKGSSLEEITNLGVLDIPVGARIPGVATELALYDDFDADQAGKCLDAQYFGLSQQLQVDLDYQVFINAACHGCSCKLCPNYLVAKPKFADAYCSDVCPQGSVRYDTVCLGACPTGWMPDDQNVCNPTLCSGFMFYDNSGNCRNATVVKMGAIQPWPHRQVFAFDGNNYTFGDEDDYANDDFKAVCPVVLGFRCYKTCPPGYMTREIYGSTSYINMECHSCAEYGLHGWYAGKCWSACPYDMVSENGICVSKCSAGMFDDAYFCLPYCRTGYAFNGECVYQCPTGAIIGRDVKRCLYNCPENMRLQDGVCVYNCDYGLEYDTTTGKCAPCKTDYAWLDTKCVAVGTKDCMYMTFEDGISKCLSYCYYGQLRNGSMCVSLDKEQGKFSALYVCDVIDKIPVWNEQMFCYLETEKRDLIFNIHELHQISECEFASLDMSTKGSLQNVLFAYNVSMSMPDECSAINITLFAKVGKLSNITVTGVINITNTRNKEQVRFAISQDTTVVGESNTSEITQNLRVAITGGWIDVLSSLIDSKVLPSKEVSIPEDYKYSYNIAGKQIVIYSSKKSTFNFSTIPRVLEFMDDMDNLKLVAARGQVGQYFTSAVAPKILNLNSLSITECQAGYAVSCSTSGCECQSTLYAAYYLYGVQILASCGNDLYIDEEHHQCYDVCPDGYGYYNSNLCLQCEYYSLYGQCVQTCPGFSYGKTCIVGGLAAGFVVIDNTTVQCGDADTSPFFESGKCVERCSAGQSSYGNLCLSICPSGTFEQYKEELGYSECVNYCDFGFYEDDFVCKPNCLDMRFRKYRECRFDCDGVSFNDQCLSECPIGYVNNSNVCVLCPPGTYFNVSNSMSCASSCNLSMIVNHNGIRICCTTDSKLDICLYTAGALATTKVMPTFTDGAYEQQDCRFMFKSSIWLATQCPLSVENNYIAGKDVINIIDMHMEEQVLESGQVGCIYYVLDADHLEIDNHLFAFDVRLTVPDYCASVVVSVFGNVDTCNITAVTLTGSIDLEFAGAAVPVTVHNVISTHSDTYKVNGSIVTPIPMTLQFMSSLFINGMQPTDHIGGSGFITQEENHMKKLGFQDVYHNIYYLGESTNELLQQYYAVLQLHRDTTDLFEYDDSYSSLRPVALNKAETQAVHCIKGKVLDTRTRTCVDACAADTKLLGTLCVPPQGLDGSLGYDNQIFTYCPRGTRANATTGYCEPCPPDEYIQNGHCVKYCKDGLLKYGRQCLVSCPVNTYMDGIYCIDKTGTYIVEDGVEVGACGSYTANFNKTCYINCLPGYYIRNSECVDSCKGPDRFIRDRQCLASSNTNPCAEGEYLYEDVEQQRHCYLSCPDGYWAVEGKCVLESEEQGCKNPMSYRNPILKRCVTCYVKKAIGQDYECSDCKSINRTNPLNLDEQYCQECKFFYYEQSNATDQLETKFCTSKCPPDSTFLHPEEKSIYAKLKFPMTTKSGSSYTTECREHCDVTQFSDESTNVPQCSESCNSNVYYESTIMSGTYVLYKRCLRSCGYYPDENPVASGDSCSKSCGKGAGYFRYTNVPDGYYFIYTCSERCTKKFLQPTNLKDTLCLDNCQTGYLAKPIADSEQFTCVSECDIASATKFQNWANNSCVTACVNSPLHPEVYLDNQHCKTSCKYYKEYEYDAEDTSAIYHFINYQCTSTCINYYFDHMGRMICVDSCPKFAKYRVKQLNGTYYCVSSCTDPNYFISSGVCVSSCPEQYFTTERVVNGTVSVINRLCITAAYCVDPLAQELVQITHLAKQYTHCTMCNDISLTNSPYTQIVSGTRKCTSEKCSFYTDELVCLDNCPTTYNDKKYYLALAGQALCTRCISTDGIVCLPNNACKDYISAEDSSRCVDSCGTDAVVPYHVEYNIRNEPVKICGETAGGIMIEKVTASHAISFAGCYEYTEEGSDKPIEPTNYYIPGIGCVPDCFYFGRYFPIYKVLTNGIGDDTDYYNIWYCSTRADCIKDPTKSVITVNETNNASDKYFRPGTCVYYDKETHCNSSFYTLDGDIYRCITKCNVFPGVYNESIPGSQLCKNTFDSSSGSYLYYNYKYYMFETISSAVCTSRGGVTTDEATCVKTCPYQMHLQLDGECHHIPICTNGQLVKVGYSSSGSIETFSCVTQTTDMSFYYLDGAKYAGDQLCNKITGTKECYMLNCPPGYFYLYGVCTKRCANRTADACVDTTVSNIFVQSTASYVAIPLKHCLALATNKLVAYYVYGAVVFLCTNYSVEGLTVNDKLVITGSSQQNCAINTSIGYEGIHFYRQLCVNMSLYPIFKTSGQVVIRDESSPLPAVFNASIGGFQRTSACSAKLCYTQCSNESEVLYFGKCIPRVEPTSTELYMSYNGRKHRISAADCVSIIDGRECAIFRCPAVNNSDTLYEFFYHEGICVSGCVRGENGNCYKYARGNIYDSVTFAARDASQCSRLIMSSDKNDYFFSWQCSFETTCPSSTILVGTKYCVSTAFLSTFTTRKFIFSETKIPSSRADIAIADTDYTTCYVFNETTNSGTKNYICVDNYKELCKSYYFVSAAKLFTCSVNYSCTLNTTYDYLSSGICNTCVNGSVDVAGTCITINKSAACAVYASNGQSCAKGDEEFIAEVDDFKIVVANEKVARNLSYYGAKRASTPTYAYLFICPMQTHYYFKGACLRRCMLYNQYECNVNSVGATFNAYLVNVSATGNSKRSIVHMGTGMVSYEELLPTAMCRDYEITVGNICIPKSLLLTQPALLDSSCIITASTNGASYNMECSTDSFLCNTYVTIELKQGVSIRVCHKDNDQVDCDRSNYAFNAAFYRFECVTSGCGVGTTDGRFCFPPCPTGEDWVFDGCIRPEDAQDNLTEYQMLKGKKYPVPAEKAMKLSFASENMKGEVAFFACPTGYSYLENRCKETCPTQSVPATLSTTNASVTIKVCERSCPFFYKNGGCAQFCDGTMYAKLVYTEPYINFMCYESACVGTEYTIYHQEYELYPKLCLSKARDNTLPEFPTTKVFRYNIKPQVWDDMFTDASNCTTYFLSQIDSKIGFCADMPQNVPSALAAYMQYNYDTKMFYYTTCQIGYYMIDNTCYPNQAINFSRVMNDRMLKIYDPVRFGSYNVTNVTSDKYYRQGVCDIHQYYKDEKCVDLPLYRAGACEFYYVTASYNTSNGLANEVIHFLVDPAYTGELTTVSTTSCYVATGRCPTHLGFYYFNNVCVKKCARNVQDILDKHTQNCLEMKGYDNAGALVHRNRVQFVDAQPYSYYKLYDQPVENIAIGEAQQIEQYLVLDVLQDDSDISTDSHMRLAYNGRTMHVPWAYALSVSRKDCIIGINYDTTYIRELCTYDCKVYTETVYNGTKLFGCKLSVSFDDGSFDEDSCIYYTYDTAHNMYTCMEDDSVGYCSEDELATKSRVCGIDCPQPNTMFAGAACSSLTCANGSALVYGGTSCTEIKNSRNGTCNGYYVSQNGYNAFVLGCDPKLFDNQTCECKTYLPCILGSSNFAGQCVSHLSCNYVTLTSETDFKCAFSCPAGYGRSGNLCLKVTNGDAYRTIYMEQLSKTVWYVAIGGIGVFILLGIILLINAIVLYRKVNANKALKKSKRDDKVGYHERLNKMNAAGGKKKADQDKATKNVGRRTE